MYVLKHTPEDFLVQEEMDLELTEEGPYLIIALTKVNWSTVDAMHTLAKRLHMSPQRMGYAGLKDKRAKTTQYVSIQGKTWQEVEFLRIKDMELSFVGYSTTPVSLGNLKGNRFTLTVRKLDRPLQPIDFLVNYYDEQRFGGIRPNTHIIGKLLLLGEYEEAARVLLCESYPTEREEHRAMRAALPWPHISPGQIPKYLRAERKLVEFLHEHPGQYKEAWKQLPRRLLTLYVQAYQSHLFNRILAEHITERSNEISILGQNYPVGPCETKQLPLVGHDSEDADSIVQNILQQEGITPQLFLQKEFSVLSSWTVMRDAIVPLHMTLEEPQEDDAFPSKQCQRVTFTLPKGSYATLAIKQML